jgi:hypothetical protein
MSHVFWHACWAFELLASFAVLTTDAADVHSSRFRGPNGYLFGALARYNRGLVLFTGRRAPCWVA